MIDPLQVRPEEPKGLRLFTLDVDREEFDRLRQILKAAEPGLAAGHLADLLGVAQIDATKVEIFDIHDLEGFGLFNYLIKANGLPDEALAHDRARIEALTGYALILYSGAFHASTTTLRPAPPIRPFGAWTEDPPELKLTPLRAQSARGQLAPSGAGDAPAPDKPGWPWLAILLVVLGFVTLGAALFGVAK